MPAYAVENVLTYMVGVFSLPESIGGVFDIGGSAEESATPR